MGRSNGVIGELKGKIEVLIDEVLPRIERTISKMEEGLNNHLAHHTTHDEKKSDRWFKIGMIVFQVVLSSMITYLLIKR